MGEVATGGQCGNTSEVRFAFRVRLVQTSLPLSRDPVSLQSLVDGCDSGPFSASQNVRGRVVGQLLGRSFMVPEPEPCC